MKYKLNYENIFLNIFILIIVYIVFALITTIINPLKWDSIIKILYLFISFSLYFKTIKTKY